MPINTHRFINRFPQPVDPADRPVLRQGVPGVEGEVVAHQVLVAAVEVLRGDADQGDGLEGGVLFLPFHAGVFDGHVFAGVLLLHLQGEAGGDAVYRELLVERGAQEVRQFFVEFRQLVVGAGARGGDGAELDVVLLAELVRGYAEVVGLQRAGRGGG